MLGSASAVLAALMGEFPNSRYGMIFHFWYEAEDQSYFFFRECFFYFSFTFFRYPSLFSIVWLPSSQYLCQNLIKLVHGHSASGFRTISQQGEDGIDWCDISVCSA